MYQGNLHFPKKNPSTIFVVPVSEKLIVFICGPFNLEGGFKKLQIKVNRGQDKVMLLKSGQEEYLGRIPFS